MSLSEQTSSIQPVDREADDWTPIHPLDTAEEDGGWLPTADQLRMAILQQMDLAIGPDAAGVPFHRGLHSSMRQAFGLTGIVALIAALPSIAATWLGWGSPSAFPPVAGVIETLAGSWVRIAELSLFGMDGATVESVVGGAPWLWALGAWLGAPVRFWTLWFVGGLLVFALARMIGARTTLPRFFAATGYAFLPLVLLALLPVSLIGAIALIVAGVLFILMYAQGVQIATNMEWGHVLIAILLPIVLVCGALFFALPAMLLLF